MELGKIEIPFGAHSLIIETGKLAKQANAAVTVRYADTVVLVTACMAKSPKADMSFFPLTVEYQEKIYSAGRIPGGFFKREGRPTQKEILSARLIDRPSRPLFPEGFLNEVQIIATVLSSDGENDPDLLALIGASAALTISDIPFEGPFGAVRVGLINDEFVINPTYAQRDQSLMDLVVVGLENGIVMIEGEANGISESKLEEALQFAFEKLQPVRLIQSQLQKQIGKPKVKVDLFRYPDELIQKVRTLSWDHLKENYRIVDKQEREDALNAFKDNILKDLSVFQEIKINEREVCAGDIKGIFEQMEYEIVRELVLKENKRADGRGPKDIREIRCEINVLPRTHGSGLFTRGQTQSLAVVTLGTRKDEQLVEDLEGLNYNNFMLHYNFPAFSTGETKPLRGPGRREIGHGALAAKALKAVLPSHDQFPYTMRVVSEILESNGSSSMASVCAGCLSLMVAGVPIRDTVAGISIGLISQGNQYCLLTDIMGLEDHFGEMDFKIAGTRHGINAVQLDLKTRGLPLEVLMKAVAQSKEARILILDKMETVISKPNTDISVYAPRIILTQVPPEKIGEVIGPGGKTIKGIIEQTGVETIDIDDDGKVQIASMSRESAQKAVDYINGLVEEPEIGKIYNAKVTRVANFGAFCEFLPGRSGLCHVSELSKDFVKDINTVVKVGDEFKVKLVEIDQMKRMNLSKKQAEAVTDISDRKGLINQKKF